MKGIRPYGEAVEFAGIESLTFANEKQFPRHMIRATLDITINPQNLVLQDCENIGRRLICWNSTSGRTLQGERRLLNNPGQVPHTHEKVGEAPSYLPGSVGLSRTFRGLIQEMGDGWGGAWRRP